MGDKVWKAKIAAYLHDPATKAIILMRGLAHEKGSVKELRELIFGSDLTEEIGNYDDIVNKADHLSASADRVQLPMDLKSRVIFVKEPQIIHPLTGQVFEFTQIFDHEELLPERIESLNFENFKDLIVKNNDQIDWKATFLSFWRLGPEMPPVEGLGALWKELPADTRIPDHSIWEHLNLTSAFAGAIIEDPGHNPALLLVSFGPVQGFISQARSVSDLWAGSHLLSMICWQGIRVICDEYGPDAILFPSLYGVPIVDVWLRDEVGLSWDRNVEYPKGASDLNPLFSAAFPNRFVAIVPESKATELAFRIKDIVRGWIKDRAMDMLKEMDLHTNELSVQQINRQFNEFPEVNWTVVPWEIAGSYEVLEDSRLKELLEYMGAKRDYVDKEMDKILRKDIIVENSRFYTPNPGVAYPGIYELLERFHLAVKSVRLFDGELERGYRCSICGEREWITDDKGLLNSPPGQRQRSVWERLFLNEQGPFIKEGEHLCGWCALKRFWPKLFVDWLKAKSAIDESTRRYVVSTHTMALSTSIWNWINGERGKDWEEAYKILNNKIKAKGFKEITALPRKLFFLLDKEKEKKEYLDFFKRLPCLLDSIEGEEELDRIYSNLKDLFGRRPETYYGLILMDGDRMGRWLAGKEKRILMKERFHTKIREELISSYPSLDKYLSSKRPSSPSYHQAVSSHLNNFSIHLARLVVEEIFMGKLIYAGGDDLMAMVAVHDLPGCMLALRFVYSGIFPEVKDERDIWRWLTGSDHVNIR